MFFGVQIPFLDVQGSVKFGAKLTLFHLGGWCMIVEYHIVSPRTKDQVVHEKLGCILGLLVVVAWDQVGPTLFKYRLVKCRSKMFIPL